MIDLTIHEEHRRRTVQRARERNILIPTFEQMVHPENIPGPIRQKLQKVGMMEINPLNLFRITWKNEPVLTGGGFNGVNFVEIPKALTGVPARIFALVGKWFPTGAHKVGATFGCLVPRLITGQFDPTRHKAVWPSTGNYCRGGAYNSTLLGCDSIAVLPEEMSQERFDWLRSVTGEVITTPGGESNVKEIYDKCKELQTRRDDVVIFNQFDQFGNYLWHYYVTGRAIEEVLRAELAENQRLAGLVLASGSAGTLACGDYLKQRFPNSKIAVSEPLQCPTLLENGYGSHRIEGIGDKHVPWIHNVRNTDMVMAIDDEACLHLVRLFNDPRGQEYLTEVGLSTEDAARLPLMGISGVANLISAIQFARYYELSERDAVFTIFTDSMDLYQSRLREMDEQFGRYTRDDAIRDYHRYLMGITPDPILELSYRDRRRIHNLKYFTWVEQQGKSVQELNAQWYDYPDYWESIQDQVKEIDRLIIEFNRDVLQTL